MGHLHGEMVSRLRDRYRFTIVAANIDRAASQHADWMRVRVPDRPQPLGNLLFFFQSALRARDLEADLVHVCGACTFRRADLASVHFCHAGFLAQERRLSPSGAPLLRRLNTGANRLEALAFEHWSYRASRYRYLVAVSPRVKEEIGHHYPKAVVRYLPNGVDVRHFRPDPLVRERVRQALGVTVEDLVAIFVGGDWDRKGLDVAIEAVAAARSGMPRLKLWVVGEGDRTRFRRLAQRYGVADLVTFHGFVSDPGELYQAADVYLGPSSYETFSLALLEAAATGLPLLTTDVGIARELVDGGSTGGMAGRILPRVAEEFSEWLRILYLEPGFRSELGEGARRRSLEFSLDKMAERTDHLYRHLLQIATSVDGGAPR